MEKHKVKSLIILGIVFILFVSSVLTLVFPVSALLVENTIFFDNFESYPIGSYPEGWYGACSLCRSSKIIACYPPEVSLSTDYAFSGTKSLAIKNGLIYHKIPEQFLSGQTSMIGFEFSILVNGGEGSILLRWYSSSASYNEVLIDFYLDHNILVNGKAVLGTWTQGKWYRIKLIDMYGELQIWINGELKGINIKPLVQRTCEGGDYFTDRFFIGGAGFYIDDVRVFTIGYTPPQVSIDVFTDKGGRGTDPDGGFYNIGDDITIYWSIDGDVDFLKVWIEKPDGTSVTLYSGSAKAGTYRFPAKVGTPVGERKVKAIAYVAGKTFSDEVRFYASEAKKPPVLEIFHNFPTEWSVSEVKTITVTVKNTGGSDATNVKSGIGWYPDDAFKGEGCSGQYQASKLAPGEQITYTCDIRALRAGTYTVQIGATADGGVSASVKLTVTVKQPKDVTPP
ncbi:MAG: CARDB domain-containing protein, partial [Thermosulfidibacteraceae bacterium]